MPDVALFEKENESDRFFILVEFDGSVEFMCLMPSKIKRGGTGPECLVGLIRYIKPDPTSFEPPCPGNRPVGNPPCGEFLDVAGQTIGFSNTSQFEFVNWKFD